MYAPSKETLLKVGDVLGLLEKLALVRLGEHLLHVLDGKGGEDVEDDDGGADAEEEEEEVSRELGCLPTPQPCGQQIASRVGGESVVQNSVVQESVVKGCVVDAIFQFFIVGEVVEEAELAEKHADHVVDPGNRSAKGLVVRQDQPKGEAEPQEHGHVGKDQLGEPLEHLDEDHDLGSELGKHLGGGEDVEPGEETGDGGHVPHADHILDQHLLASVGH